MFSFKRLFKRALIHTLEHLEDSIINDGGKGGRSKLHF